MTVPAGQQTGSRPTYFRFEALASTCLMITIALLIHVVPGVTQTRTSPATGDSDADTAYVEALRQYDRADVAQNDGLAAFKKQIRVAADKGSREARAIVAVMDSAANASDLIERFKPLAQAGIVVAETFVGSSYTTGAKTDYALARQFLQSAANKPVGGSEAQFELGRMYSLGQGTPANELVARRWLRKSAANGNPQAQRVMAQLDSQTAEQEVREKRRDEQASEKCKNFAPSAQFGCQLLIGR